MAQIVGAVTAASEAWGGSSDMETRSERSASPTGAVRSDRPAFNTQTCKAFAGSGKTTVAAEFARWHALTGGVARPVLFTSFEQYRPLALVLDQLGLLFNSALRQSGRDWQAITDSAEKRDLALQLLRQIPVLWVWDNVEPIAGFPAGTPLAWTVAEQRELADFLRAARGSKASFLLTSWREERGWLGELPARIILPPMPMHERRQLAEALATKYGVRIDQAAWRPLLLYSQGNPLTLTVVVSQALRDGLRSGVQFTLYVQRLRTGEAIFNNDASEGRSKSLGASLSYGFEVAFTEQERAILALLHHFQGFVQVGVLEVMGDTSKDWHVPTIARLTRDQGVALLDRAVEVGLLAALGEGTYRIHPALPWFFRCLYNEHYGAPSLDASLLSVSEGTGLRVTRAFVEAMGVLGNYYTIQYVAGNQDVIAALKAEEANLLHAWRLAREHGWYWRITSTMQGLRVLYKHTGRRAEWRQLVAEVVPLFVDPTTNGPLPGREEQWAFVMEYQVLLLREERQWTEAARLQGLQVDYNRRQAASLLALPPEQLDNAQRNTLRSLAVAVEVLGTLQRKQGEAVCVDSYQEGYALALRIGDHPEAASCAFNLGHAYIGDEVPALRDLALVQQWYQRGRELTPENDHLTRGKAQGQLGYVIWERFKEAQQAGHLNEILLEHLNAASKAYYEALEMMPPDAINELATICHQLGLIYSEVLPAHLEQAIAHYREAIRYKEQLGDRYGAAQTRENVAIAYANAGRFDDALLFAHTALRGFQQFGPAASNRVAGARQLIAQIEQVAAGRMKDEG